MLSSFVNVDKKYKFQFILIFLFPISLITGPFLSDLTAVILSIFYIFDFIKLENQEKKKEIKFITSKYFNVFLFFYTIFFFHSLLSEFTFYSLKTSLLHFRFVFYVLALKFYFSKMNKDDFLIILRIIYLTFFILISDTFLQYFSGENILGYKIKDGVRVSGLFGEELILGSYLSRIAPIMFGLMLYLNRFNKNNSDKIICFVLLFILEIAVFLTGERSSFFYITLVTLFLIVCLKDMAFIRMFVFFFSLVGIFLISSFNDNAKKRMVDQTMSQIGIGEEKGYLFSKHHSQIFDSAWKIFKNNNFIGIGSKNFRKYCEKYAVPMDLTCTTHPHNHYLQVLIEGGILAFIIYVCTFLIFCFNILKHIYFKIIKKTYLFSDFQLAFMGSLLIILWPFIPNGNFFNNWLNSIYFYQIGFFIWSIQLQKRS